jgi:hypothetical protein
MHAVTRIFTDSGLRIFDVEELPTHGGSLRIYGCNHDDNRLATQNVDAMLNKERKAGLLTLEIYRGFQSKAEKIKNDFLEFLITQKRANKKVAAYGAAAKGNTLLNFAGIKPDLLPFVCDAATAKQGKYLPGSHIPIIAPSALQENRADFVVILPWNIASEVMRQNNYLQEDGVRFVTAVPELKIV